MTMRVGAAVGHGFQLLAQRHGLGAGLPGVQDLSWARGLQASCTLSHIMSTPGASTRRS
jgi:hypothetical protein